MASDVDPSAGRPPAAPTRRPRSEARADSPSDASRIRLIRGAIVLLLVILLAGLAYQQLGYSAKYAELDRRQTHRQLMTPAPRGVIYDREHRVLAGNRTRIDAVIHLGELRHEFHEQERTLIHAERSSLDLKPVRKERRTLTDHARFIVVQRHLDQINRIIGRDAPLDPDRLQRHVAREKAAPFTLVEDLAADEITRLTGHLDAAGPVRISRVEYRWYPHGSSAAHVLGWLKRETIVTSKGDDFPILNYIGMVGESGIEKEHEARLRGKPGETILKVDAYGFPVGPALAHRDPIPGEDVVLSIDLDLQLAAERAMSATPGFPRGAAVAIQVATGEVLAMASKPDFNLNELTSGFTAALKERIDHEGGWLNRAIQGLYPPGSSFKIFTALAGLRSGGITQDQAFHCDGFHLVNGRRFVCHNTSGHGDISLRMGLAKSCNVFAYVTGLAAGPDALAAEAKRFHLGDPTGIDLPFEATQMLVPDPTWKQEEGRGTWTTGDTINLSIGQGDLRYSPLQTACAMASLARRETLTVPTLLHHSNRRPSASRPSEPLNLSESHYNALIDGLRAVVEIGIGQNAQVPGVSIAGKSGTAQVSRPEGMMNVAWFIAFAPVDRPEIAIAVAMEGDKPDVEFAGAEHAAPIVRELFGTYFDKR